MKHLFLSLSCTHTHTHLFYSRIQNFGLYIHLDLHGVLSAVTLDGLLLYFYHMNYEDILYMEVRFICRINMVCI